MGKAEVLQFALLLGLASLPLSALDQVYVRRGNPERQGRAWMERSEFGAPAREGGRLVVRLDFGSVRVHTGPAERVDCKLTLRSYSHDEEASRRLLENYDLKVRQIESGGVYVTGQLQGEHQRSMSLGADLDVTVPQRYNLDVETQGGDLGLEDALQGEIRFTTAGGDIRTADVSGAARLETAGGNVSLGNMGQAVDARTAGGNIHVGEVKGAATLETSGGEISIGQVGGALRAETAGGDVVIAGADGQVVAQTAGGQIQVGPTAGGLRAQTAGGSIRCTGARGRVVVETAGGSIDLYQIEGAVRASTAAGRILAEILANKKTFGASQLESSMGDVFVFIPPDLPVSIDAAIDAAAGHHIISDFPLKVTGDSEQFTSGSISGRGPVNGGGELLRLRTVSGNIEIRKLDAQAIEQLKARQDEFSKRWQQRQAEKEQHRKEREQRRRERQQGQDQDSDEE